MNIIEIIEKKKNGFELTDKEINFFIGGCTTGKIANYQISALLMAICINGMTNTEIFSMTKHMASSGICLKWSGIDGIIADKHSSGGVGDKTTPIVVSVVTACGVKMVKMSGKGLGFTGGTIDKLSAITNFRTDYNTDEINNIVNNIGAYMGGQTHDLAPADKKLYCIRDVTGTVNSIPLIASSIMSKKIASGANILVLDVKAGGGAFMKNANEAQKLAELMVNIGNAAGIKTCAVVTDMSEPLGCAVGNALEIKEIIDILKGKSKDKRLYNICVILSAYILILSKKAADFDDAYHIAEKALKSGQAFRQFYNIVQAQGGDVRLLEDISLFPRAKFIGEIISEKNGYVQNIDCESIGKISLLSGAGRIRAEDVIDYSSGVVLHKKCGDSVLKGEVIAEYHTNRMECVDEIKSGIAGAYHIGKEKPENIPLVYKTIMK
jgi:pyrimidine-nucleoside phosphorylase